MQNQLHYIQYSNVEVTQITRNLWNLQFLVSGIIEIEKT